MVIKQNLKIENIPAILWGDNSDKLFIAVHGNMSNKSDNVIVKFAEEAVGKGYQVLSFDLPEHGERKYEVYPCKVQNCVHDLKIIMHYVKTLTNNISIFACSMGVYFSLLSYKDEFINEALFLSPVVDMERIINNMMKWINVTKEQLKVEKEILTPIGQTLYWDYYCYVKENPINKWDVNTSILYGGKDDLCEADAILNFSEKFNCKLDIMEEGEHYFHTEEQIEMFGGWLKNTLFR
ncbi:alpha/beta hydrolase [Clostridium sp. SHJSY1]|uniref:alpha/beta hydrolase n=1 Tax=Clostridium sp. SHJSY1 TaxID=2942483 RepID=UPI00287483E1|nr:alpha/beta hydrolase [Clostridium sp. SHJSY1]MDS0525393.1 alpha/beta hydrolase [Clostridium sp. SHJSY1]